MGGIFHKQEGTEQEKPVPTIEIVYVDVSPEELKEITKFYNEHFPLSPRSEKSKEKYYRNASASPINMVMRAEGEITGLLESADAIVDGRKVRLLQTIAISTEQQGKGLGKSLFEEFKGKIGPGEEVIVHFRDSKKEDLEKFYRALGFSGLKAVGKYKNGETKWEMNFISPD